MFKWCLISSFVQDGASVCVLSPPRSIAASRELPLCSHNSLSYSNGTWQASALSILIRCTCNQSIKPTDRHFIIWAVCCLLCMCWTWYRNIDDDDNNHHLYLCFRIKHPKLKVEATKDLHRICDQYICMWCAVLTFKVFWEWCKMIRCFVVEMKCWF